MIRPMHFSNATAAWRVLAGEIFNYGNPVAPRSQLTKEISHATLSIDMHYPVLACKERKLSYKFMAAEPLWYLSGSKLLEEIARYNPRMREFSDDGRTLYGAYGPPFIAQQDHVLNALRRDRDTRQAVLTIWRENPRPSKDVPCTVSLGWRISMGALHCHVHMRSSDVFLGVPYDWFSFTILTCHIAARYNYGRDPAGRVQLGHLHYTANSAHLYQRDMPTVRQLLATGTFDHGPRLENYWLQSLDHFNYYIGTGLANCRDGLPPVAGQFTPRPTYPERRKGNESHGVLSQDCSRCGTEEQLPEA